MQFILALDIAGNPFDWLHPNEAVHYYAKEKVAYDFGEADALIFRGGYSRSGEQSIIRVKPIVAVSGSGIMAKMLRSVVPLGHDNDLLFRRDRYTCAYCGNIFKHQMLSRDHIVPKKHQGQDTWMNCVTACKPCNQAKGHKLIGQFRPLVYVPYAPCRFEHFLLSGRNVLADQHDYLSASLPRHSRMLA
ncbi:MAG: HNH endonuclease [Pseudomonadota bacterium]